MIKYLRLTRPIFRKTACGGHFGRTDPDFTWEKTDMMETMRDRAGLSAVKKQC
jgi:S-adenosylmethionine synthetase